MSVTCSLMAERATVNRVGTRSSRVVSAGGRCAAKPEVFYEIIENMYPEWDKVELFARKLREGWYSWGNQLEAN